LNGLNLKSKLKLPKLTKSQSLRVYRRMYSLIKLEFHFKGEK